MKKYFLMVFCLLLISGGALAQKRGSYNPNEAPPSVEEYQKIPKGILMPESFHVAPEAPVQSASSAAQNEKPVLTLEEIRAAFRAGKYDEIRDRVVFLAMNENHDAEELLGIMYKNGKGVEKNPALAVKWLQKAADVNRPLAQHHLGTLYFTGEGVAQDPVTALMWLHLATVYYPEGMEKTRATQDRDAIKAQISRRDRDRALSFTKEWLAKKGEDHLLKAE